jgi:hypothetical protein
MIYKYEHQRAFFKAHSFSFPIRKATQLREWRITSLRPVRFRTAIMSAARESQKLVESGTLRLRNDKRRREGKSHEVAVD